MYHLICRCEYSHEWPCVFCKQIGSGKRLSTCAPGHSNNPFDGVCISPTCSLFSHVRMCTCLRLRAFWVCRPASRVRLCPCMYACVYVRVCVFQESQWLDSVSLLIKDTLEGEMLMIDNLSGSVFHHYSSPPPVCKNCKGQQQQVPP